MRSGIACVNPMVFEQYRLIVAAHSGGRSDGWTNPNPHFCTALLGSKYQRLVAMLLRPECPGNIFAASHHTATLIVKTDDRLMPFHLRPQGRHIIFCQIHSLSSLAIKA